MIDPSTHLVPTRRQVLLGGVGAASAALLAACSVTGTSSQGGSGSGKGKLQALFMQQAGYSTDDVTAMLSRFHGANPDIEVVPTFVAYEALHDKIVTAAAAGAYDVVLIDVIWPAEFATTSIIADVSSRVPGDWKTTMLGGALATAEYQDKFYGVGWGMDTKFFYHNTEMLTRAGVDAARLETWDGVLAAARALKSKGVVEFPLAWSWSQAEALMCDYTQLLGAFGGRFLDDAGRLAINTGGGVAALQWMRQTIVDGLTNPASTTFLEADVQKTMNDGQAAMSLNWTYYLATSNDTAQSKVAGQVAVARTPAGPGGLRPGVNGAMALAISSGSKNQDAAWKLIEHLTSEPELDRYASHALPIWKASYTKPAVVDSAPETFAAAKAQLDDMILRPGVANYNAISQAVQVELQNALLGRKPAQQALDDAVKTATPLMKG